MGLLGSQAVLEKTSNSELLANFLFRFFSDKVLKLGFLLRAVRLLFVPVRQRLSLQYLEKYFLGAKPGSYLREDTVSHIEMF